MAYTKFGELVRIIRIRHHEVMGDMAKKLGLKLPFLSAIESGKKNVPADLITKIIECYHLSAEEEQELIQAAEESRTQYKISTIGAGISQRKAALQFARSFDKMDDETALRVLELLSSKEDGD